MYASFSVQAVSVGAVSQGVKQRPPSISVLVLEEGAVRGGQSRGQTAVSYHICMLVLV